MPYFTEMHRSHLRALSAALAVTAVSAAAAVAEDRDDDRSAYVQTNLISSQPGVAPNTNANLQNAWGIAFPPAGPFWVNSNNTGLSFLVDGTGAPIAALPQVTIPLPTATRGDNNPNGTSAPTGIFWNGTSGFVVPADKAAANFVFDTEDGTIVGWNGALGTTASIVVDNSHVGPNNGAVYKGLAFGVNVHGSYLFAANFRAGTIDVYDSTFTAVLLDGAVPNPSNPTNIDGKFTDPDLPAGYAPHGVHNIDGDLYVAYAQQDTPKHDDVAGAHLGFVNVFDTAGHLLRRFASRGALNAPWGVALAPAGFGQFAGDILVGNFGDGRINVYDKNGDFIDQLEDPSGRPITIDGLWALNFGGGLKSSPDTLYFSAGPKGGSDGLFGTITAEAAGDDHDAMSDDDR
jgi:uncharacterized protein (TIGR03118 family)